MFLTIITCTPGSMVSTHVAMLSLTPTPFLCAASSKLLFVRREIIDFYITTGKNLRLWRVAVGVWRLARCRSNNLSFLVDEFKVVTREQMRDRGQLRAVARSVVIEFEEWDGEELHVLWYAKNLCIG